MYNLNQEHVSVGVNMQMGYFVLVHYDLHCTLNIKADEI